MRSSRITAVVRAALGTRVPELSDAQVDALEATKLGDYLLDQEGQAMHDLEYATDQVSQKAHLLKKRADDVVAAVTAGHRIDPTWVEQTTRELAEQVTRRQAAVDQLIQNRHAIKLLLDGLETEGA